MAISRQSLSSLDFSDIATGNKIVQATPGEILKSQFLDALGITQYRLAKSIGVPAQRIGAIISEGRAITADTDVRLCHFFQLSEGFFLRLQVQHDIAVARLNIGEQLGAIPNYREVLEAA